jgi:PAS domain S-box-containing protein
MVLYFSPIGKDIWGYNQEDVIGKNFIELVHPDDRDLLLQRFLELSGGVEKPLNYRFKDKTGNFRWVRTSTKPRIENGIFVGASGTLIDITKQKEMETLLSESEKGYRELSIKLQDAYLWMSQKKDKIETRKYSESIIFLTAEDGQICGFTEKALGITKKSRSDLQGCNIQDILVFQEGQTFMDLIHKARQKMSQLTTLKFKNQLEDGPVYEAKLTRIFVESKGLFYIVLY